MVASIEHAKAIGADVMRVVGSSLMFRNQPHQPQLERLTRMFSDAVKVAEKRRPPGGRKPHRLHSDEMLS